MNARALRRSSQADLDRFLARRRQRRLLGAGARFLWEDARASIGIPASKIDYSQVTAIRMAARGQVENAVYGTVGQAPVVRDGFAFDFSGSAAGAARFARLSNRNALVAQTWDVSDNAAGGLALANNRAISIYGYEALSATPLIDAIRFVIGGSGVATAMFVLAPAYADMTSAILYFDPPVFYAPGQTLQYDLLSEVAVAAGAESFQLLALVGEIAGANVLPSQSPGA